MVCPWSSHAADGGSALLPTSSFWLSLFRIHIAIHSIIPPTTILPTILLERNERVGRSELDLGFAILDNERMRGRLQVNDSITFWDCCDSWVPVTAYTYSAEFLCKSTECSCVVDQSNDSHPSTFLPASQPKTKAPGEDSTVPEAKRILHCLTIQSYP